MKFKNALLLLLAAAASLTWGTAPSHAQIVINIPTTTTLQVTDVSPILAGQIIHYLMTVTAYGRPVTSGYIAMQIQGSDIPWWQGPLNANGQVSFTFPAWAPQSKPWQARFEGAGQFAPSVSNVPPVFTINQAPTTTTLSAPVNAVSPGQIIKFTVTIAAVPPSALNTMSSSGFAGPTTSDGWVYIWLEGKVVGSAVPGSNGIAQIAVAAPKSPLITFDYTASYSGGSQFLGSTSNLVSIEVFSGLPQ